MKTKKLNPKETTEKIKEILVVDSEVVKCEGKELCYPEAFFEMIEQCKLCGKCV